MTKAATTWLSPKAFGAQRRPVVTRQAVMRAIADGRLSTKSLARTDRGHWRIEPEQGNVDWDAWTDPTKTRAGQGAGGRPPATPSLFDAEARQESISHARASAKRISVDTELRMLELEERRGELVPRGAVTRVFYEVARDLRERLLAIPDRVAAPCQAAATIASAHSLLTQEITHALESLARAGIEKRLETEGGR